MLTSNAFMKKSNNDILIRNFQLTFSLRSISLRGGPLQPSRHMSLFTLATSMILFLSKPINDDQVVVVKNPPAAVEKSTSDGLTVEGIIVNVWNIYDENESDWKSHASAIAQSIHLIKTRLGALTDGDRKTEVTNVIKNQFPTVCPRPISI
ncbi:unnamed protein product [Fraxinus pennsylvanica]|uniref:Uncharacterized protein n=1 Tax=Fraxinus pennsylvanica TaxID=56036 RepID=A0AAD2DY17_9LAMI|nr:unnamed protein product [Fraxinus pennsylvanica]